jgi:hypothetical protein
MPSIPARSVSEMQTRFCHRRAQEYTPWSSWEERQVTLRDEERHHLCLRAFHPIRLTLEQRGIFPHNLPNDHAEQITLISF